MKVKNLFGMAAMAALVLSGCSSDEVVNDYSPENAIEFGTYVGRGAASRASEVTTKELGTLGFGVFASYTRQDDFDASKHSSNFMYNQKVVNTSAWNETNKNFEGDWKYAPIKYWPNTVDDKVSFFAYAPYCTTENSNVTVSLADGKLGYPSVTYAVVNDDIKKQSDLLWAAPVLNLSKNSTNSIDTDDKVKFTFKHALSRIAFEVQTMIDKVNDDTDGEKDATEGNGKDLDGFTKVVVKEVTLSGNFYTGGTLTWKADNTAAVTGTTATSPTTFKLGTTNFAKTETVEWGTKDTKYTVTGQSVNQTEAQLNAEDSYIMVVPQDFTNENLTITVKYDVVTADANLAAGYINVPNEITTSFNGVKCEANKAYKFSLHLGLTTVKLTASVDGWVEENGIDYSVNLPINTTGNDNTNEGVEDGTITPATPSQGEGGGQQNTGGVAQN